MSEFNIIPNASKTIESLRHLTYTNVSAIADIVDNSLDAHAENITISVSENNKNELQEITIIDDGVGMPIQVMQEAIKLGSDTEKDQTDLGRFGMGLVTASISMARRIEVVSKEANGEPNKVVLDLDDIADTNTWRANIEQPSDNENSILNSLGSGTIVNLRKVDKLQYKLMSTFVSKLMIHLSEVFRHYIDADKNIILNGNKLTAIDPLELWRDQTEIMFDEDIKFKESNFSVKFVLLENTGQDEARHRGYNIANQGIYIVRNQRQIARALSFLEISAKHNDLNRVRVEISYSEDLDDFFGINFTKDELVPKQALLDVLVNNLKQFYSLARKRAKINQAVDKSQKLDHKEAEDVITRKSKLLKTKNVMELRSKKTNKSNDTSKAPEGTKKRENIRKFQQGDRSVKVKFGEVDLGETGDLYVSDFEGTMLVINWNINHPFHSEMVAKYSVDKDISLPLDFFLYSLVTAELSVTNEQNLSIIESIKSTLSTNLRVLMK